METAIYARISKDRAGEGLGVARQEQACRAKAEALGWTVGTVYTDNDVSASKSVPRPEYERLLADLTAGTVRALVVYDLDRLTRKPAELETFIDLADKHGVSLANVSGDVDLTNANGRMIARIKGAVARQEAERIGERNKAQKAQRAAMGLPMGTKYRVYGYERDWAVREEEAAVVRSLFERYLAGESKGSLTRWMQDNDHKTTAGSQWSMRQTTRLLENAGYAGIYMFKGEEVGATSYPALVDRATFEAVAGKKETRAGTARSYLLTSILVCGACYAPMIGAYNKNKGKRYRCNTHAGGCGGLSIKGEWMDDLLNTYMATRVSIDWEPTEPVEDNRLEAVEAEIALVQNSTEIAVADKIALLPALRAKQKALLAEQADAKVAETRAKPIEDYDNADLSVKRAEIKKVFSGIVVAKVPKTFKTTRETLHQRLTLILTEAEKVRYQQIDPDCDGTWPGINIDVTDIRPVYGVGGA